MYLCRRYNWNFRTFRVQSNYRVLRRNIALSVISNRTKMTSNAENGHRLKRGAFIVFEGLDRSGKSTQSKLLVDALNKNGTAAHLIKFPTREGPVGKIIDGYLRKEINLTDESVHLLFSADRWESRKILVDLVSNGNVVVADRYAYSGIAFSAAKGLNLDWCISSDTGLPAPDLVIFLNIQTDAATQRDGFGMERYEKSEFQKKVIKQYEILMERDKKNGHAWTIIDGSRSVEIVHQNVVEEVQSVLEDTCSTSMRPLTL